MLVGLAQASGNNLSGVFLWTGALFLLAILGGVIWFWLRRRLFDDGGGAFSIRDLLKELEASRDAGHMTDEEFQRARDSLLGVRRENAKAPDHPGSNTGREGRDRRESPEAGADPEPDLDR